MHELLSPTINFSLFVVLLFVLLRKPLKKMLVDRRSSIETLVSEARAQKDAADKKYAEFSQKLALFESEAKAINERARADAEAMKAKIIAEAKASAEKIVSDAQATVDANLQEYKDEIKKETIAKAIELAEKIIREAVSADDQRRIVSEYVGRVQ